MNHFMRKIIGLAIHFLFMAVVVAQQPPRGDQQSKPSDLPTILPPSPTVAALMHFEEVPVNNYSGQPSIGVPIFSKALTSELGYNIGLSYSTLGIRAEERSGWVGKGWALDGEAVISRTVRDIADEIDQIESPQPGIQQKYQIGVQHNTFFNWDNFSSTEKDAFMWKANGNSAGTFEGNYDNELDLFQLNLFGATARFVIIKENHLYKIKMISNESQLQVSVKYKNPYEIESFTVTDRKGNKYLLDQTEESTSRVTVAPRFQSSSISTSSVSSQESRYISAWKISSVKKDSGALLASFNYKNVREIFNPPHSEIFYEIDQNVRDSYVQASTSGIHSYHGSYNDGILKPAYSKTLSEIDVLSKKLSSVVFRDQTKVEFISQGPHPEYKDNTGVQLKEVKVLNKKGDEIKKWVFTYSGNPLFLNTLQEVYGNNTLTYHLSYNEFPLSGGIENNKIDIWGYRKGTISYSYDFPYSANKDVVMTGALKSISYPTGGKKEFIFESNTFTHEGSRMFTDQEFREYNPDNATIEYKFGDFDNANSNTNGLSDESFSFSINESTEIVIQSNVLVNNRPAIENSRIHILDRGGNRVAQFELDANGVKSRLDAGTYTVRLFSIADNPRPGDSEYVSTHTTIYYRNFKRNLKKFMYGGGIRIKEIRFTDADQVATNTLYEYHETESGEPIDPRPGRISHIVSSGVIDGFLTKTRSYTMREEHILLASRSNATRGPIPHELIVNYKVYQYPARQDVAMSQGSFVGYKKVKVVKTGNGSTEYTYSSAVDHPTYDINYDYPFPPVKDMSYLHGNLLTQTVYDQEKRILSKDSLNYRSTSDQIAESIFIERKRCVWNQFYGRYHGYYDQDFPDRPFPKSQNISYDPHAPYYENCLPHPSIEAYKYPLYHSRVYQTGKISKAYFYDTNDTPSIVENSETYDYDTNSYQPNWITREVKENGVSRTFKQRLLYRDTQPIWISNNEVVDESNDPRGDNLKPLDIVYKVYGSFQANLRALKEVKIGKGENGLETRLTYHRYDNYGNPLEVSQSDGIRIIYIWGYDDTLPIAKIVNASYEGMPQDVLDNIAQIKNTLSTSFITAGTNEYVQAQLNSLRNHSYFRNAQFTSMTHIPLIGVDNVTDPRGNTTYYSYDEFNRLKLVKDKDANILSRNEYNYKNN